MGFFHIIHLIVCLLLVCVILFQDGKTGGLVSVADSSQTVFGAKGASNFLTKLTSVLAVLFMTLSITLAYQSSNSTESIASGHVPPTVNQTDSLGAVNTEDAKDESGIDLQDGTIDKALEGAKVEVVDPSNVPEEIRNAQQEEIKRKLAEAQAKRDEQENKPKDKEDN